MSALARKKLMVVFHRVESVGGVCLDPQSLNHVIYYAVIWGQFDNLYH